MKVEDYVISLLQKQLDRKYAFHNLFHTTSVVDKATELVVAEKLSTQEVETLLMAAWFHDTGYIHDQRSHEESSCAIAIEFLTSINSEEELIVGVCKAILSTRLPQTPATRVEQILCDADLHHLGSPDYPIWSQLLLRELKGKDPAKADQVKWTLENIAFFQSHRYFTNSAIQFWQDQKMVNLQALREASVRPQNIL